MHSSRYEHDLDALDSAALESAVIALENPGYVAQIADVIGTPIEKGIALLPKTAREKIGNAAQKAVLYSLKLALTTMDSKHSAESPSPPASDWWHKGAVAISGGVGGFFGIAALVVELPVSTTIIMRSIADVARSEGADLTDMSTLLACVQVLALGGSTTADDGADVGYFAAREMLAKLTADAAAHIAEFGIEKQGAPALVRLILAIAERYSIPVSAKAAAQSVPAIGAAGGALLNTLFIDHFQDMARGHFIVSRLEKKYGLELVKEKYQTILDTHRTNKST